MSVLEHMSNHEVAAVAQETLRFAVTRAREGDTVQAVRHVEESAEAIRELLRRAEKAKRPAD